MLFNEPKLLKSIGYGALELTDEVSVLFNEPKLLKCCGRWITLRSATAVSVLFNEPKLLKSCWTGCKPFITSSFSALQRAEIAEIYAPNWRPDRAPSFSALQRAEIAEIATSSVCPWPLLSVSVLFNEPKLLK